MSLPHQELAELAQTPWRAWKTYLKASLDISLLSTELAVTSQRALATVNAQEALKDYREAQRQYYEALYRSQRMMMDFWWGFASGAMTGSTTADQPSNDHQDPAPQADSSTWRVISGGQKNRSGTPQEPVPLEVYPRVP